MNVETVRSLLEARSKPGDTLQAAAFATLIYVFVGFGVFSLLLVLWDWMPGPVLFMAIYDPLFLLLALGGATMRAEGEEMLSFTKTKAIWMVYGGGFFQTAKSGLRALFFALPSAAVEAVRSALPPLWVLRDPEAVRLLGAIAGLRGGVSVQLFARLAGSPPRQSLRRAIELARYLDAVSVRREGGAARLVPGPGIGDLRRALEAPLDK